MPNPPCPYCQGPTLDNRLTRKNPKGPDFRCANPACKFSKKGGAWVPSQFSTGLWLDKTAPASPVSVVQNETVQAPVARVVPQTTNIPQTPPSAPLNATSSLTEQAWGELEVIIVGLREWKEKYGGMTEDDIARFMEGKA